MRTEPWFYQAVLSGHRESPPVGRIRRINALEVSRARDRLNREKETVKEFSTVRRLSDRERLNAALRLGGDVPCLQLRFEEGGRA
jgi:hypothetical protein